MQEPVRGPRLLESDGATAIAWVWPQAAGPELLWVRARSPESLLTPAAAVAVARTCPGQVVATEDVALSAALADAGLPLVRHLHAMAADPRQVATARVRDDLRLAPLSEAPLDALARLRLAAFPPGHPDHSEETVEQRVAAFGHELADPDNLVHPSSRSAWLGDDLVGCCVVTDSRHMPGFVGPWVMNVSRLPGKRAGGAGAAMLVDAARAVSDAGGDYLGLAVTDTNPARRLYERMGWSGLEMWLHHVPEGQG
ncbi:GNAT family N-acetyltransferase [Nocardioides marmoribigeumensis]|uniref:GNAT superfamily N-acetyltransferase n=1 Tax=Nocardioides marmoribigeumensis TaxID=433649 RepID=A0ABU2C114_9ACTN|nr:GNAT family N-acetyltransferase [Nocardioides marmoribigeumensis]MDR7364328.1 GNAT superfamily N-acetyltransferase [Nocardioides marmoribigeumensis]